MPELISVLSLRFKTNIVNFTVLGIILSIKNNRTTLNLKFNLERIMHNVFRPTVSYPF